MTLTPNRGARVASISLDEVRAFFEALDLCQRAITRLAASRRRAADLDRVNATEAAFEAAAKKGDVDAMARTNFDFHMAIADAAGNPWLARFFGDLLNDTVQGQVQRVAGDFGFSLIVAGENPAPAGIFSPFDPL